VVEGLRVLEGQVVLDMGAGTGLDSVAIAERVGPKGMVVLVDISPAMLKIARGRMRKVRGVSEFIVANGSYLPFAERVFNGSFTFGSINTFGEKRRAIQELVRVTRIGGRVVIGDEGVAPWLKRRRYGRMLIAANRLYTHRPPIGLLPEGVREVELRWVLGNAFYVLQFEVSTGAPSVDIDLPIPGERGGTLRSRYKEWLGRVRR
jgi:SAM-dependent methyltransferase